MSKVKQETIEKMQQQKARLDARIQQLRNRQTREERKKDTRRKILAGAYFIKLMGGDLAMVAKQMDDAGLLRSEDAALFSQRKS
ncbi:MAG: hypothetical protein K2Y15_11715 [Burkholderiaceae bacterium]|nr:hypothetical protein [Burkholderiaceae bacterium]